jgi:hypothetical protein
MGTYLDRGPDCEGHGTQLVTGLSLTWHHPFHGGTSTKAHAMLLHIDLARRRWTVFDPSGNSYDIECATERRRYHFPNAYALFAWMGRDVPPDFRLRLHREMPQSDAQTVFERVYATPWAGRVCPKGCCTMVSWLVFACCRRFQYFDLHVVAAALRRLVAHWETLGQPTYQTRRVALLDWQNQLLGLTDRGDLLRHLGLWRRRAWPDQSPPSCDGYDARSQELCPHSPAWESDWVFCESHRASYLGYFSPPAGPFPPVTPRCETDLRVSSALLVRSTDVQYAVLFSPAIDERRRWAAVDRDRSPNRRIGVCIAGLVYDDAVHAEIVRHVLPMAVLGRTPVALHVELRFCVYHDWDRRRAIPGVALHRWGRKSNGRIWHNYLMPSGALAVDPVGTISYIRVDPVAPLLVTARKRHQDDDPRGPPADRRPAPAKRIHHDSDDDE